MEYRNQFHKESTERKMKQIEEWKNSPPPSKESARKQFEMHQHLAETYQDKKK